MLARMPALPGSVRQHDPAQPPNVLTHPTADVAARAACARRRAAIRSGAATSSRVPPQAAVRRARGLYAAGWWPDHLTTISPGLTRWAVMRLVHADCAYVTVDVDRDIEAAAALLGVCPGPVEAARWRARREGWPPIDAWGLGIHRPTAAPYVGHRRRMEALAMRAWGLSDLAALPDCPTTADGLAALTAGRWVPVGVGAWLMTAYDQLTKPDAPAGPSPAARDAAAVAGWVPALAWDDDTIDDPQATPDLGAATGRVEDPALLERLGGGDRLSRVERGQRLWLVAELTARGWSAARLSTGLGVPVRTIERDRHALRSQGVKILPSNGPIE